MAPDPAARRRWEAGGTATFVGFGFGAIQAGLFLYEASRAGIYRHLVVAEVVPEVVAALRQAGGTYAVNIARLDGIETAEVGPVVAEDPAVHADRTRLVEAIAAAQGMATAVPSVNDYRTQDAHSLHRILAEGLQRKIAMGGPPAVVYAAENQPHAASLLREAVMEEVSQADRAVVGARVAFVDTVIGKMCGVVAPPGGLAPITPQSDRAFLVEAFNHVLTSRPELSRSDWEPAAPPPVSGIPVFEEKADLQPFEEAKLYGHNAVHALGAYLGLIMGLQRMDELAQAAGMVDFLRAALVEESGAGIRHRYAGVDPLFTAQGFEDYAESILTRIVNPHLRDAAARVGRDPARKLGWNDRLVGAMRLAHAAGVRPWRYALGAAAALHALDATADPAATLPALWRQADPDPQEAAEMLRLVQEGQARLQQWKATGFSPAWLGTENRREAAR